MLHILSHSPRSAINIHRSSPSDSAVYRFFFWWCWLHKKTFGIQEGSQIYIQIENEQTRVEMKDLDLVNKRQSGKLDYRSWTCITCIMLIQSGPDV